jgi:CxxC-x17-CxxC domain-containing protein
VTTFADKTLVCRECGKDFIFTRGEQEFYQQRGLLHEPARCPEDRANKKRERTASDDGSRRMYPIVCANCGREAEVPFEPRLGRPVYCSDCYPTVRGPR